MKKLPHVWLKCVEEQSDDHGGSGSAVNRKPDNVIGIQNVHPKIFVRASKTDGMARAAREWEEKRIKRVTFLCCIDRSVSSRTAQPWLNLRNVDVIEILFGCVASLGDGRCLIHQLHTPKSKTWFDWDLIFSENCSGHLLLMWCWFYRNQTTFAVDIYSNNVSICVSLFSVSWCTVDCFWLDNRLIVSSFSLSGISQVGWV